MTSFQAVPPAPDRPRPEYPREQRLRDLRDYLAGLSGDPRVDPASLGLARSQVDPDAPSLDNPHRGAHETDPRYARAIGAWLDRYHPQYLRYAVLALQLLRRARPRDGEAVYVCLVHGYGTGWLALKRRRSPNRVRGQIRDGLAWMDALLWEEVGREVRPRVLRREEGR